LKAFQRGCARAPRRGLAQLRLGSVLRSRLFRFGRADLRLSKPPLSCRRRVLFFFDPAGVRFALGPSVRSARLSFEWLLDPKRLVFRPPADRPAVPFFFRVTGVRVRPITQSHNFSAGGGSALLSVASGSRAPVDLRSGRARGRPVHFSALSPADLGFGFQPRNCRSSLAGHSKPQRTCRRRSFSSFDRFGLALSREPSVPADWPRSRRSSGRRPRGSPSWFSPADPTAAGASLRPSVRPGAGRLGVWS